MRDTVEWAIPILWPIDLLNLPRRGPRPVLKAETQLTVKVMDDVVVPIYPPGTRSEEGFAHRAPMSYSRPQAYARPEVYTPQLTAPATASPLVTIAAPAQPAVPFLTASAPVTALVLRSGYTALATHYWFEGGVRVRYVDVAGTQYSFPIEQLDLSKTLDANRRRGSQFVIR